LNISKNLHKIFKIRGCTLKNCFVISPIGEKGTEIYKHAKTVFKKIIEPAMDRCEIKPLRADQIVGPGQITGQIWENILTSDLCIAVTTYDNPNVYYELAVAQSAEKPVIILHEVLKDGEKLPFDIKDLRCVFYDFNPDHLFDNRFAKKIVENIKFFEERGWKGLKIIPTKSIIEGITNTDYEFYEETKKFGPQDNWDSFLKETVNKFDLMSKSANTWKNVKNLSQVLLDKAANGCKIRILIMHKENPALQQLSNPEIKEKTLKDRCREIDANFEYYSEIANQSENIEIRQILEGCSTNIQAVSDEYALYIPYFYSQLTIHTPLWKCKKDSFLFNLLEEEFETLWRINH